MPSKYTRKYIGFQSNLEIKFKYCDDLEGYDVQNYEICIIGVILKNNTKRCTIRTCHFHENIKLRFHVMTFENSKHSH